LFGTGCTGLFGPRGSSSGRFASCQAVTAITAAHASPWIDFLGATPVGKWRFVGTPTSTGIGEVVIVDETGSTVKPLPHMKYHSPGGLAWGYKGSGAADLARSILSAVFPAASKVEQENHRGVSGLVDETYQLFKEQVIAHLPEDGEWELSYGDVESWMHKRRLSVQPEPYEDHQLPYEWHLYPGGLVGQQYLHRGDPGRCLGFSTGPEDPRLIFAADLIDPDTITPVDPERCIGLRLVGMYDDPDTGEPQMASYGNPISRITHLPRQ
jgi:LSD1 subclass zinc finger protein